MAFPVELSWDERGLLPAVVQDIHTGETLMVAWMNAEALELTRETGEAHFYSRSRQALWRKGETSGNTLAVRELRVDCDADVILLAAEPAGPACHTGKQGCFYRAVGADGEIIEDDGDPGALSVRLERVLCARRDESSARASYTRTLIERGWGAMLAKIAEEHAELAAELPEGEPDAVVHETADLIYHVMVALVARGIPIAQVWRELGRRFGTSGHVEKASR
jgi:phosphoribosyl-AMP cyclohydrolase / phosphoribosyl-ATP pyrophosphohydrolase